MMNVDGKTGTIRTGRMQLAMYFRLPESTVRNIIKRLESKYEVLTTNRTTKYTEIRLLNWDKYQKGISIEDNQRTTKGQPEDTILEDRREKIEERDTTVSSIPKELHKTREYLTHIPEKERLELQRTYKANPEEIQNKAESLHNWLLSKGRVYKDYRALLKNALLKDFGKRQTGYFMGMEIIPRKEEYAKPN